MTMLDRDSGVIFVVDDEEMITNSLGEILGREGFDVFGFTNPLKALDRMETVGPDLLISDVVRRGKPVAFDDRVVVRELLEHDHAAARADTPQSVSDTPRRLRTARSSSSAL